MRDYDGCGWPDGKDQRKEKPAWKANATKRKAMRKRLWRKHPTCSYCGMLLTFEESTLDHVVPVSRGGGNTKDNLVIACSACNKAKSNKDAWDFRRITWPRLHRG